MGRRLLLGVLLTMLLLCAACGSSGGAGQASGVAAGGSSVAKSSSPAKGPSARVPAGADTATAATTRGSPTAGAHVRLPATFTIGAGASLRPASISSPADLAVELTLVCTDSVSHRVVLRTPTVHALTVPARGRSSILIGGLRSGRYELLVDGARRGALLVGGEPGP